MYEVLVSPHTLQQLVCSFLMLLICLFNNMYCASLKQDSEKAMAPHSSTLAWKIPWTEESGRLQSMVSRRVGHDWATSLSLWCIGEGNGNPLQCSCLENPRDRGARWAAVYGVAQSPTRLKRLSSSSSSKAGFFNLISNDVYVCLLSCFSHVWLCDSMDHSLPISSVHRILPARILEWGPISFSRSSSVLWGKTRVSYISCIGRQVLYH